MRSSARSRYQAVTEFVSIRDWWRTFAVTLTLKQAKRVSARPDDGSRALICGAETTVFLDRQRCIQNFRHFMNLLNCRTFGNAFRRHGKRVRVIAVLEHDDIHRWHYHAAIECPPHIDAVAFPDIVRGAWAETDWGHRETDIKPEADDGWVRYMLKARTKDEWDLCIDWENSHIF